MDEMTQRIPVPKAVVAIIDRKETARLEDILREKHTLFHYMWSGKGTASSELLRALGLSGTDKTVCFAVESSFKITPLFTAIVERMELTRPGGKGIAFVLPVSGASAAMCAAFTREIESQKERWDQWMENEAEKMTVAHEHELVVAVVNQGYSEEVMEAARGAGARGGTVIHGRHANLEDAAKFYGVSLQAEKEIVAIVIDRAHKKALMSAIVARCGAKTDAHGIVVALPVENCAGLASPEGATKL